MVAQSSPRTEHFSLSWFAPLRFCVSLCFLIALGCSRKPPAVPASAESVPTIEPSRDTAQTIGASLSRDTDLPSLRRALQQLNTYLSRHPEEKPADVSVAERELLANRFKLEGAELHEISQSNFTALDAHHLELCFLLRDVVHSLQVTGLSPRDQAAVGFAWVARQIQLRDTPGNLCPPLFVLRRGWGIPQERALVFLTLLHQMGIDGCMIACPRSVHGRTVEQFWAVGALVDHDIWLFDLYRGIVRPGTGNSGPLTLAQLRAQPPASLPPEVRQSEAHIVCSLSALAPRMRYLEATLGPTERARLSMHPTSLLERFRKATTGPAFEGSELHILNSLQDPNSPLRLLRMFLPPADGGIDQSNRKHQAELALIPWDKLPAAMRDLPGEPGSRLHTAFAQAFLNFALAPNMPRDLLLRGQLDEATRKLVELRDQVRKQKEWLQRERDLEAEVTVWCKQVEQAHQRLAQAEDLMRRQPGPQAAANLEEARTQLNAVWQSTSKPTLFVQAATAAPLAGEIDYLLALCQHEKAEREQRTQDRQRGPQAAALVAFAPNPFLGTLPWAACLVSCRTDGTHWKQAARRWQTYLDEYPAGTNTPAARRLQRRARQAMSQAALVIDEVPQGR
jgi:hypothetical protein